MSLDVGYASDDDGRSFETGRVNIGMTLMRIESNLGIIKQDIAYMRESNMNRDAERQRQHNDHEARLRAVEAKRYIEFKSLTAIAAIILPICAIIVSIVAIIVK